LFVTPSVVGGGSACGPMTRSTGRPWRISSIAAIASWRWSAWCWRSKPGVF